MGLEKSRFWPLVATKKSRFQQFLTAKNTLNRAKKSIIPQIGQKNRAADALTGPNCTMHVILLDYVFNMKYVFEILFYWSKPARRMQPEFTKFDQFFEGKKYYFRTLK